MATAQSVRFAFGKNWQRFSEDVDLGRVEAAKRALREALAVERLDGLSFLDVGAGSGIHSLAARQLGARVHSFDYDPDSVACARALRAQFLPDDPGWTIEQGSALDAEYLHRLGRHDIVYSWGVLHHTGDQWRALALIDDCVADAGVLVLALYNDQGPWSRWWRLVKQTYVGSPAPVRTGLVVAVGACLETKAVLGRLVRGEALLAPLWSSSRERGMHRWIDLVDWVGGYPFEVSTPEQVFEFYRERGYTLTHLRTCGAGGGCNEFVFRRIRTDESSRQPGEP